MELERLWWGVMCDQDLHHQLLVGVFLGDPIPDLLLKNSEGLSDDQVTCHPKLMGSSRQVMEPDNLFQDRNKLEEDFWTYRPKQRHVNQNCLAIPFPKLGLDVEPE